MMLHKEIGERLGLTKMRICQIEKEALHKLRVRLERRGITREDILEYFSQQEQELTFSGATHRRMMDWGNHARYDALRYGEIIKK